MGASFLAMGDLNDLNATLRWSVARSRLDGNDTIIYLNPSISALTQNIERLSEYSKLQNFFLKICIQCGNIVEKILM